MRPQLLTLLWSVLPVWVAGNYNDELLPWQKELYKNDTRIFLLTVGGASEDDTGVYSRTGEMTVPGNERGFHYPVEFYTGHPIEMHQREPMRSGANERVHQFEVEDLGNNETFMWFTSPEANNILLRLRELDDRWIAYAMVNEQPIAAYYSWVKLKYKFGVPVGYEYINIHGHAIKECKVMYDQPMTITLRPGTHTWEMKRGMMYDPLCDCEPRPICGIPAGSVECADFVPGMLQEKLLLTDSFRQYQQALVRSEHNFSLLVQEYTIDSLGNASCANVPQHLPPNTTDALEACTDVLLYDIVQREVAYLTPEGHWKGPPTQEKQMKVILNTPRSRWLACMHSQTEERLLKQSLNTAKKERDQYRSQLTRLWSELDKGNHKHDNASGIPWDLAIPYNVFLTFLVCLWLICRDCCCGICRCCRTRRRKPIAQLVTPSADVELAPPREIPSGRSFDASMRAPMN